MGSVRREDAQVVFPFLAPVFHGRRKAIKEFTHLSPDYVFWIFPDGRLFDAKDAHRANTPKGYAHILDDEPDYGGFLRGRVAANHGPQLVVVYCRPATLAGDRGKIEQFLKGMAQLPVPLARNALVISDNGDIYGTMDDLRRRVLQRHDYGGIRD